MRKIITLSLLSLIALSALAENIKTIVYSPTPVMTCENCEKKIKTNVRFVKGTKRIETSLKDQTVTITYDADKAKPEDYVEAFAKIGRKVREVPASDKQAIKAEKQADKKVLKAEKEVKMAEKKAVKADKAVKQEVKKAEKEALKAERKPVEAKKK